VQNAAHDAANRWRKYAEDHPDEVPPPKPQETDLLGKDRAVDPGAQLASLFQQFKALGFDDKLTVFAGALLVITLFFPWRRTLNEGEVDDILGILSISGVACFGFAVAAIASVLGRIGNYLPQLPRAAYPVATMIVGGLSILTAIVTGIAYVDRTLVESPMGNTTIANSTPLMGVWLAAIISGVVVLGGFLTFARVKITDKA
jgi:hypothetical protein